MRTAHLQTARVLRRLVHHQLAQLQLVHQATRLQPRAQRLHQLAHQLLPTLVAT